MILKKLKPLQTKYLILIINHNRLRIQQNLKNLNKFIEAKAKIKCKD